MIYLETMSGLGNRLRAIASVYRLSVELRQPILVLWPIDDFLRCKMSRLFRLPGNIAVLCFRETPITRRIIKGMMAIRCGLSLGNDEIKEIRGDLSDVARELGDVEHIHIKTSQSVLGHDTEYGIFDYYDNDFSMFSPVLAMKRKLRPIVSDYGDRCIGVHIRRGDHQTAIEHSPTAAFIAVMKQELSKHRNTKFYLATDSTQTEKQIHAAIGESAFVHKPVMTLTRDSSTGVRDAFVELLCLSKTQKVYGSYFSSFSQVAAAMTKIPYEVVGYGRLR